MNTRFRSGICITFVALAALAEGGVAIAAQDPSFRTAPARPLSLAVVAPTLNDVALQKSANDVRISLGRYPAWFRIAPAGAAAEVIVELQSQGTRFDSYELRAKLTILNLYTGPIAGTMQVGRCTLDCWSELATQLATKVQGTTSLYLQMIESRLAAGTVAPVPVPEPTPASAPAPATAVDPAATNAPAPASRDLGVDVAMVKVESANLRKTPAAEGALVKRVARGDLLVLVAREQQNGWYNVVDADSADEGWIRGDLVDINLTSQTAKPVFETQKAVDDAATPQIEWRNDTTYLLAVTMGSQRYQVTAGGKITVDLVVGENRYVVKVASTTANIMPLVGSLKAEPGLVYARSIYVK